MDHRHCKQSFPPTSNNNYIKSNEIFFTSSWWFLVIYDAWSGISLSINMMIWSEIFSTDCRNYFYLNSNDRGNQILWFGVWTFTEFLCLTNAFAFIVASLPRDFLLSSDRPRHPLLMVGQSLSVCDCWRCPVKGFSDCCDCWFLSSLHFTSDELESRVGNNSSPLETCLVYQSWNSYKWWRINRIILFV